MCTSFKSIFNHRTTAVVFGGRCRAQVRNLKLWVSLIILGNIMGVQEHSWYKRLGVKPQCHPLRTLMHHIELHRHECLIIFFPSQVYLSYQQLFVNLKSDPIVQSSIFIWNIIFYLRDHPQRITDFFGHFLTYLPISDFLSLEWLFQHSNIQFS